MPKQSRTQRSVYWMKIISLGLMLGLGIQFAEAWTSPTLPPPNSTISGPITNGLGAQYKTGMLGVNSAVTPLNALEVGGGGNALIGGNVLVGGRVGIGIVTPQSLLHVAGGSDIAVTVQSNNSSNGVSRLQLGSRSGQHCGDVSFAESDIITSKPTLGLYSSCTGPGNGDIKIQPGEGTGNVYIPFNNFGIGTTNPTEKLDVNGSAKVTGVLASGKVQIVDVVAENTACAPNGLVARDSVGLLLSCQSGTWKKASGGGGGATVPCHWNGGAYVGQLVITCNGSFVTDMAFVGV